MRPELPLCLRQSIPIGSLTVGSWEEYVDRGRASEALAGYRLPVCSFRAFPPFHSPILQSSLEGFTTSTTPPPLKPSQTGATIERRARPPKISHTRVDASAHKTLEGLSPAARHQFQNFRNIFRANCRKPSFSLLGLLLGSARTVLGWCFPQPTTVTRQNRCEPSTGLRK